MNKNTNKTESLNFKKYQISLLNCIGESATAVLVGVEGKKAVWIDKKYMFKCEFCLKANVSLVEQWTYKVIDLKNDNKYEIVKYDKLVKIFNDLEQYFFVER